MKELRATLALQSLPWPVLVGLGVIGAVFQLANPNFLTPLNLTNLLLQIAATGTLATGMVLVLLLGEIDLSAGAVSGLCAACMAVLHVRHGVNGALAAGAALVLGATIGTLQGWWITRLRVPSFVVTLAGLLAWQGALLFVLGSTGSVNLRDPFVVGLAGTFLPSGAAWIAASVVVLLQLAARVRHQAQRARAGLATSSTGNMAVHAVLLILVIGGTTAVLTADRGFPLAVVILVGMMAVVDGMVTRTRLGRHILAVGSNAEAARRAGIPVSRVRITAFALCSTLAALGGVLAASRLQAVNQSSGSGDLLLNAIASAVIGGTSLFGGKGSAWSALLGALVIGSISNGMDLLALESSIKFMVTGAVLLVAVTVDALGQQGRR
ncbi:MAG: sugar ABC transporter permease [Myxococcota bacterium]